MKIPDLDLLATMWLDGFASGITTANVNHGVPEEIADGIAQRTAKGVRNDPDAYALVLSEIRQRLVGIDLGPVTHQLKRQEPET